MLVVLSELAAAIRSGYSDSDAFWQERSRNAETLAVSVMMGIPEAAAISKLEDAWEQYEEQFEKDRRKYFLWFIPIFFGIDGEKSIIRTSRERIRQVGVDRALEWIGSEIRANDIAVTETTRLYNWGVRQAKMYLGEQTKTWYTMLDERVCEICAPMHAVSVPIDDDFILPTGEKVPGPPAHGRCRCEEQ